ncbi:MAG: GIY-YIG nuclease family protein [Turicibacter sp.]
MKSNQAKDYSLYAFTFSNNIVYIGITDNVSRRKAEHYRNKTSRIGHFLEICGHSTEFTILKDNLGRREAQKLEKKMVEIFQPECNVYWR